MEKAFIWDLDGTLLDSYGIIVSSLQKTCQDFGITADELEIHREVITKTVDDFIHKIEREYGIPTEIFKQRYSVINDGNKLNIKPVEHAADILRYLSDQGNRNFVFTHRGFSTEPVLKNTGLYSFFSDIVTGQDGFARKPDPGAVNYLVQKYSLNPGETFYVGDRTIDIECAVNAGIGSILYLPEDNITEPTGKETYIIHDLLDIKDLFGNNE